MRLNNKQPMNPQTKNQEWIICPYCGQPNLSGKKICKYCWSPRLSSGKVINTEEMQRIAAKKADSTKRRHILKIAVIFASLAVAFIIFILPSFTDILIRPDHTVSSGYSVASRPMFRQNFTYSGGITDKLPRGKVQWTFHAGAVIQSSPAVVDGTVYFGSRNGRLYAVDTAGTCRWEFHTGSWVDSSPVVAGGIVYAGSNDGHLYALNAETGKKIWSFNTRYPVTSAPAISGGMVYFGSTDGIFYALDAITGKKRWRFRPTGWIEESPIVVNGVVCFSVKNTFYTLNARNGCVRLQFKSDSMISSSPYASGTSVYFGTMAGVLYAVDSNARNWPLEHWLRPKWIRFWLFGVPIPQPPPQSGSMWGIKLGGAINSSPVVVDGIVYLGVGNDIVALAADNRKQLWRVRTRGPVKPSPVITGGVVYCGSDDGRIYALEAASGNKVWNIKTGGSVESSPIIVDGILYVGSHDGSLYAIK